MRNVTPLITCLFVSLAALASPAPAQISPQQKAMAQRAAELDACRLLGEQIMGLKLTSTTHVKDMMLASEVVTTSMDTFIKGVRYGQPSFASDGSCEITAEVTLEQVITELKRTVDKVFKNGKWTSDQMEEIRKYTDRKVIQVVGAGAPNLDAPDAYMPDLASLPILPQLLGTGKPLDLPAIWKKFPANRRLMARRGAQTDAYRQLAERLFGMALTSETFKQNMVTKSDDIKAKCDAYLRGVRFAQTRYRPDGIAEVQAEVTVAQAITTIKKAVDEVYGQGKWTTQISTEIQNSTRRKVFAVIGIGALDTSGVGGTIPVGPPQVGPASTGPDRTHHEETTIIITGPRTLVVE